MDNVFFYLYLLKQTTAMNNHRIAMKETKVPKRYKKQYDFENYLKSFLKDLRITLS